MNRCYGLPFGYLALICSGPLYAQATADSGAEIVVTAQKRAQKLSDVPMSISAVSGDTLEQAGVRDPSDLPKLVAGLNYTKSNFGLPVFTLRGIGYNDTSLAAPSAVSLYRDEFALPVPYMATGANFDVERVEVLKGPQGILFGQNSTGGAINFVTRKPTRSLEAGFDLSVGRFSEVISSGYISGPLSDSLRARIFVRKEYSGPWQKSSSRDDKLGNSDRLFGRLLVEWDAAPGLRFNLGFNGWRDRSDTQAAQYLAIINPKPATLPAPLLAARPSPESPRAADWDPVSDFARHDDFWQLSLRGDYEISPSLLLTSLTSYGKVRVNALMDVDGLPLSNFTNLNAGTANSFAQELRLSGKASGLQWLLGANFQRDHVDDSNMPTTIVGSAPFRSAQSRGENLAKTYAAFGHVEYELTPHVSIEGGLRYTRQNRSYAGCLYDSGAGDLSALIGRIAGALSGTNVVLPPGACVTLNAQFLPEIFRSNLDEDNISWKAGASWKPQPDTLVYANISKGYKSGTYVTTGATFYSVLLPARQESVLSAELGFKQSFADHRVQLSGAVFHSDFRNKQIRGRVPDPALGLLARLLNIPKSRIYGAEFQADLRPLPGLTVNMGGSYVNARITGTFPNYTALGRPKDLDGERFPLTPPWQLTGGVNYETTISPGLSGFVGVNGSYQSATNAALGEEPLLHMKGFFLADANFGFKAPDDSWRVQGYIRNLGNTYYYTNVVTAGVDTAARYAGFPRTYGVSFSYRYR